MTRTITLLAAAPALALSLAACGPSSPEVAPSTTVSSSTPAPGSSTGDGSTSAGPSTSSGTSGTSGTAGTATAPVISIADFAYTVPASVAPGAKITIRNSDSQAHTVTSQDGGFDVKVDPGATATMTAPTKPGSYKFVCRFHGNMSGTLVVR
ncbi:cupredoxin domain-containing protein [Terrabacter carboxydivorans]|uniref:EfeO-type cupredoxin-like domain-containing protein n=1 Tax=Terrabacter carboxydivorans TaxID=619730 RepID=A0ABP5ZR50_9MICO